MYNLQITGIHEDLYAQIKNLDDFELMIAACALTHNLNLVTNNEMHFRRIDGLKVTNRVKECLRTIDY